MASAHDQFMQHYLAHQELLRAYIAGVVRDRHVTDDLMQEVGMVLWRKWDHYDPERPFGAWARGVTAKILLKRRDQLRRRREVLSPEAIAALATAYDGLESSADERLVALERCVGHLDERARTMLRLRYADDLELGAIASRLRRSAEAVGKALQRLRQGLAGCVERQLAGGGGRHD